MNKKFLTIATVALILLIPMTAFIISKSSPQDGLDGEPGFIEGDVPADPHAGEKPDYQDSSPFSAGSKSSDPSFEEIIPGKSTQVAVINALGKPSRSVQKDGSTILYFRLANSGREHKVYLKNDIVDYTIEQIVKDNALYTDYLSMDKEPSGAIYNLYENDADFNLYIFSDEGIGFLAHEPTGFTAEIHHFKPIDYQTYFTTLAPKLTFE